jgi:hypothetical protein
MILGVCPAPASGSFGECGGTCPNGHCGRIGGGFSHAAGSVTAPPVFLTESAQVQIPEQERALVPLELEPVPLEQELEPVPLEQELEPVPLEQELVPEPPELQESPERVLSQEVRQPEISASQVQPVQQVPQLRLWQI